MDPTDARHNTATNPHGQPFGLTARLEWAYRADTSGAPAAALLAYIAYREGVERRCFASVPTMAAELHVNATTIRRALRTLEVDGLIVQVQASTGGRAKTSGHGITSTYRTNPGMVPAFEGEPGHGARANPGRESPNPGREYAEPGHHARQRGLKGTGRSPPSGPPVDSDASAPSAPLGGATGAPPVEGAPEPSALAWVLPPFAWQSEAGAELRDVYLTGAYEDMDGPNPKRLKRIAADHGDWVASDCKQPDGAVPWRTYAAKLRRLDDVAGEAWTAALREYQADTECRCVVCLEPVAQSGDRCERHPPDHGTT